MRTGSLVLALHNLDLSGANQVLVNIVSSSLRESNVVVLAPKLGPASQRFFDVGASIRIGDPKTILNTISDVILVLCNTIMTADISNLYPSIDLRHMIEKLTSRIRRFVQNFLLANFMINVLVIIIKHQVNYLFYFWRSTMLIIL